MSNLRRQNSESPNIWTIIEFTTNHNRFSINKTYGSHFIDSTLGFPTLAKFYQKHLFDASSRNEKFVRLSTMSPPFGYATGNSIPASTEANLSQGSEKGQAGSSPMNTELSYGHPLEFALSIILFAAALRVMPRISKCAEPRQGKSLIPFRFSKVEDRLLLPSFHSSLNAKRTL